MAFSMSPSASISAARQSAKPALVRSRNSFTSCAGILLLLGVGCVLIRALFSLLFYDLDGDTGIPRPVRTGSGLPSRAQVLPVTGALLLRRGEQSLRQFPQAPQEHRS